MKTKIYKVELLIIDHDDLGPAELKAVLEHTKYPNRCISPEVKQIETREVEWSDDHPLNSTGLSAEEEYDRLFKSPP